MRPSISDDTTEEYRSSKTIALTEKTRIRTTLGYAIIALTGFATLIIYLCRIEAQLSSLSDRVNRLTVQIDRLYEPAHASITQPGDNP